MNLVLVSYVSRTRFISVFSVINLFSILIWTEYWMRIEILLFDFKGWC